MRPFFWLLVPVVIALVTAAAVQRKEAMMREGTRLIEGWIRAGTDYDVRIGHIGGRPSGLLILKDIEVHRPWMPAGETLTASVKEIRARYRFLDFLSKRYDARISLEVVEPRIYWKPRLRLKRPSFPFLEWMRRWALSRKDRLTIDIRGMSLELGALKLERIGLFYEDNRFRAELPLTHLAVYGSDVSTVIKLDGRFELGGERSEDRALGEIRTEGSVINWQPLAGETNFEFIFSREHFQLVSSDFLGGISVTGGIDFENDFALDITLNAERYPLARFAPLVAGGSRVAVPGQLDLNLKVRGTILEPFVEAHARIRDGWIGKNAFEAMDINLEGFYPTLRLGNSRILTADGVSMRFADTVLEAGSLFSTRTYRALVQQAAQDNVEWGEWAFSRPLDSEDRSEFQMKRLFGEHARLSLRKYQEEDPLITTPAAPGQEDDPRRSMEAALEYRLQGQDSLKLGVRGEDEEFIGVEKKWQF